MMMLRLFMKSERTSTRAVARLETAPAALRAVAWLVALPGLAPTATSTT